MKVDSKYLSIFLLVITTLYSCNSSNKDKKGTKKQDNQVSFLEGYIVKPVVLDQTISVSGTLKPFDETVLMPEVVGRVVKINLPEGKFVKEGTLLVKLFDGELQAQLHKSQTQLQLAEQTEKRQSELVKVNGISQTDFDQTVLQVVSIKNDIEVLKVMIRKTEVLAPYDGVIGLKNISIGAQVTPSTALATIRAVSQLKLDFSVPEKYSREVKAGSKVKFMVQGDETKYEAVVMATEEGIDFTTRNLKARAVVNVNKALLVPGAFANVELRLRENKNALMVPTQSIIPQERNKKLIVAKDGKATFITVKTGVRQASLVEVLDGIEAGDTVVTTGILFIKPGTGLKFAKVTK
jgi:membrane fusion protein (multidrug efflux system)